MVVQRKNIHKLVVDNTNIHIPNNHGSTNTRNHKETLRNEKVKKQWEDKQQKKCNTTE
jgi:hypothetical protein